MVLRILQGRRRTTGPAVILALALLANTFVLTQNAATAAGDGFLFGATPEPINGFRQAGVEEIESQLGRKLDVVRVFETWESNFPSAFHTEMVDEDRLMVVSVRPKRANGSIIPWNQIATAAPGSQIYTEMVAWADKLRDTGVPLWFAFHHEPEASGSSSYGDAADFIAAWRTFVDVFRSRGANNVEFALIMTHWSFETSASDSRHASKWYPGDSYVDLIGSDAYNWDSCRNSPTDSWRTLEDTIDPQRQFGLDHPDKGLFLAEVASTELPGSWGDGKATWIDEARALFKKPGWDQFVGMAWFDISDPSYPNCHWPIDSTPEALAALARMATDPFYSSGPPVTTTTTTTTTTGPPGEPGTFDDVLSSHPYFDQIEWFAGQGITMGCNPPDNDRFCPGDRVTRGQMAAFLVRALGYSDDGGGDLFVDDDGSVFEADIDRLAVAGVTLGCNPPINDRYCPNNDVTRGEMAVFLFRALS